MSGRNKDRVAELEKENEVLRQLVEKLRAEIERLRKELEEALRSLKRQAAPFSKGKPKANPKKGGRKPGADYGQDRQPPHSPASRRAGYGATSRALSLLW